MSTHDNEPNKKPVGAPIGNKNRLKEKEEATSHLHIRVTPSDKVNWVKASNGLKLSEWVIKTLNENS